MKPSSFENAIRLQFDCLARKVVGTTVKDYNRELGRRAKRETPFCELPEMELNHIGTCDEYSVEFTAFRYLAMKSVSMMNSYVKQSKN